MIEKEKYQNETSILATELRAQMNRLKRRLKEQADPGDFTSSQIAAILRLEAEGNATVSDLARLEGVRPQSMRSTVAALEKLGCISGHPDINDGRKTLISLTEEFQLKLNQGRAVRNDWLAAEIKNKLTTKERTLLKKAVELIQRLTDD